MKLELRDMGVIKRNFRGKAQYFCNCLFVEIRGANFKDNYGILNNQRTKFLKKVEKLFGNNCIK